MIVIFHIKYLVLYQYCLKIFEYDTLLVSLKSFVDDRIIAKKKKRKTFLPLDFILQTVLLSMQGV